MKQILKDRQIKVCEENKSVIVKSIPLYPKSFNSKLVSLSIPFSQLVI